MALTSLKLIATSAISIITILYLIAIFTDIDSPESPPQPTIIHPDEFPNGIDSNQTKPVHIKHITIPQNITHLNDTQRIQYYMGKWYKHNIKYINVTWSTFKQQHNIPSNIAKFHIINASYATTKVVNVTHPKGWSLFDIYRVFLTPFLHFLNLSTTANFQCNDSSVHALVVVGDEAYHEHYKTVPVFIKTRLIMHDVSSYSGITIQQMEFQRHWQFACRLYKFKRTAIDPLDISWKEKLNISIWRGATTGSPSYVHTLKRLSFVRQYYNHSNTSIDVGFTKLVQMDEYLDEIVLELKQLTKDLLDKKDMLKYKYLISIEGNDVASNLNWLLMSNSVVFMPKPTKETWLMEGLLLPYVHYIPLEVNEERWNLEEQMRFCLENDEFCHQVAQNAERFMMEYRFCDEEHETELQTKMLDRYCLENKVSFNGL